MGGCIVFSIHNTCETTKDDKRHETAKVKGMEKVTAKIKLNCFKLK